ncbi:MAG TPA: amidase [Thermoanaerobaculia bacterium]|jgi:amidase|nr:amidase [Thermoanaerobaculia bacterium]
MAARLSRRDLIRFGALGGAAAAAGPLAAREAAPPPPAAAPPPAFELDEATIADLQKRMSSGADSARSLAEKYLGRIEALDRRGPELRAVLESNPEALAIAERLDAERKAGRVRGPLHGVPVLLKDNIGTADRMNTTAGSLALLGATPGADAFLVQRLRDAGAVLLGKTNLSEWANFRSSHSSSGWSGRGGQCRNPYALDRSPSGSSSGSGSAIAANLCAVAVGSETDGSVVSPSNNCGLVGVKPTLGLVSRTGIVPIAHSQDTAGPMARTVTDAAILLTALAGFDPSDPATRGLAGKAPTNFAMSLDGGSSGLTGIRIGVPRKKLFGQSPAADVLVEAALADLKRLGAVIVDPADIATLGETDESEFEVLLYEFKADLNAYLAGLGARTPYKTLEDLIRFNEENRGREMPYFGQEIFEKAQAKGPLTDKAYLDALEKDLRATRREGIDRTMDEHKLDALVAPTSGPATLIDLVNGDYGPGGSSSFPAIAGYPDVTVPCGEKFGLPVGMSIFGRAWSEPTLLKIAFAYEQATKHRRPPKFLPTVDLSLRS